MSSLSAHLVGDYEKTHQRDQQYIVQSGAMEYNSMAHGHASLNAQQNSAFSQFSQASLGPAYAADASMSMAGASKMALLRSNGSITFQQMQALQQQREEAQALRTAQSIAALQAKLNQKLGPEYISQRPGPSGGPKLTYVEGWKVINLANEVFGFNGWSSSIISLTVDYIDYNQESQRYNVGVTAVVRVLLRDGVSHEDVGYGLLENCKSKGMALDKCKKEAVTDALKRTLRNFGNILGNCLYDKEYIKEILKMKMPAPPRMESKDLHRRKEFAENNSVNRPNPPMAPPPAPISTPRQAQQSPPGPSAAQSKPVPSTSSTNYSTTVPFNAAAGPSRTTPINPADPSKPPNHSTTATAKPAAPTVQKSSTQESLYTFGSDDDSMFADFSIEAADAAELETGASNVSAMGAVDFTNRSRVLPQALASTSAFDPSPRAVPTSVAVQSASTHTPQNKHVTNNTHAVQNTHTANNTHAVNNAHSTQNQNQTAGNCVHRKMSAETKNRILEGLLDFEPASAPAPVRTLPTPTSTSTPALPPKAEPSATSTQSSKPRTSSGGGFAIPPGVTRPQRSSYPMPPPPGRDSGKAPVPGGSRLGTKRAAEVVGLSGFSGSGGIGGARNVLGELEVGRDGSIKRPRLS